MISTMAGVSATSRLPPRWGRSHFSDTVTYCSTVLLRRGVPDLVAPVRAIRAKRHGAGRRDFSYAVREWDPICAAILRSYRERRAYTRRQLADELNVCTETIGRLERAASAPASTSPSG